MTRSESAKQMWANRSEEDRRKLSSKLSHRATVREKRHRIFRDMAPCCILCVFWVRDGDGDEGECHKRAPPFTLTPFDGFCGDQVSAYDEEFEKMVLKKHYATTEREP